MFFFAADKPKKAKKAVVNEKEDDESSSKKPATREPPAPKKSSAKSKAPPPAPAIESPTKNAPAVAAPAAASAAAAPAATVPAADQEQLEQMIDDQDKMDVTGLPASSAVAFQAPSAVGPLLAGSPAPDDSVTFFSVVNSELADKTVAWDAIVKLNNPAENNKSADFTASIAENPNSVRVLATVCSSPVQ